MKTLVLFYSYTGKTRKRAEALAKDEKADIFEITDEIRPGTLKAYTAGCVKAMKMQSVPIEEITPDLNLYEKIIIMAPVWAGHPAPAINNVFDILPKGKKIEVIMVSASGSSSAKEKVEARILSRASELVRYQDIKG